MSSKLTFGAVLTILFIVTVLILALSDLYTTQQLSEYPERAKESAENNDVEQFTDDFREFWSIALPWLIISAFIGVIIAFFWKKGR